MINVQYHASILIIINMQFEKLLLNHVNLNIFILTSFGSLIPKHEMILYMLFYMLSGLYIIKQKRYFEK